VSFQTDKVKMKHMNDPQVLLIINSILLSLLSILFVVIGYFLKELHRDFKQVVERVNSLYAEHTRLAGNAQSLEKTLQTQVKALQRRYLKLSKQVKNEAT
jgi:DNA anti-recombination protein RmuC